jgi:NAD(P)-dependent dehydrogenase (short-subunit alcohol dehydrogenase family)
MKNILIIGGSSGIGAALAKQLTGEGHQVFSTWCTTEKTPHPSEQTFQFDVLKDELDDSKIPDAIDALVYCPGSINLRPFSRIKPEDFTKDFELQVNGGIRVLQKVLPKLKKGNDPNVLFFSTVAVQNGFNFHTQVATSKGAIEGLTRSLAAELAPTIRVNAIAPSLTDTPLAEKLLNSEAKRSANADRHPLKKIGEPADIAEMAAFLLSDKAKWITGQIMHVDGGSSTVKNG